MFSCLRKCLSVFLCLLCFSLCIRRGGIIGLSITPPVPRGCRETPGPHFVCLPLSSDSLFPLNNISAANAAAASSSGAFP